MKRLRNVLGIAPLAVARSVALPVVAQIRRKIEQWRQVGVRAGGVLAMKVKFG